MLTIVTFKGGWVGQKLSRVKEGGWVSSYHVLGRLVGSAIIMCKGVRVGQQLSRVRKGGLFNINCHV